MTAAVVAREDSCEFQSNTIRPKILQKGDRQLSYHLRYLVYCLERRFLDPDDYPDELEIDEFDPHSMHLGAFNPSGEIVGTARLVFASERGFPLDKHCQIEIPLGLDVGEVSRLAIPRRTLRGRQINGSTSETAIQLYRAIYQTARAGGLTHLITAMEVSLARLLKMIHFPFNPIGPLSDYYGMVRPYLLDLDELAEMLAKHAPQIWALFMKPFNVAESPRRYSNLKPHFLSVYDASQI